MQRLTHLKDTVQTWHGLRDQGAYLLELVEMSLEEGDDSLEPQITKESESFLDDLREKEMELTLSGPYDQRPAILSIQSGAGGVDSQDWSQMLLRMYLRWAERRGYKVQMLNLSDADGTADEEDAEVEIRPEDLKIDFFRSSGPGGQNVQKVASAVRLTHLPTGLVVSCQTERSQHQNREYATTLLKAHLLQLRLEERAKKMAELRGERVSAEWGSQIRSYVLHPYRMVKDHRSQHQVSDATAVLDGDIDDFLKAYLLTSVGEANAPMHGTMHK